MPRIAKILIIDDDLALLAALPDMLTFNLDRIEVDVNACPVQAVQRVQEATYDVVICDLAMPRLDGIAVLQQLRMSSPSTLCILMTGHWNEEIRTKAQQAGAFACVPKPIERNAFLETIRQALATDVRTGLTDHTAVPDSNVSTS
ncbi:MAG TPA: response regulator [Nitrospiraceae bacterium]|nr:response regulator [Nitrospiraceae bacterium]